MCVFFFVTIFSYTCLTICWDALFSYFSHMRIFILLFSFLIITPAFALFQEGSSDACTLPDGSFREDCMYMTAVPTASKMTPRAALRDGTWESVSLDGVSITGATLTFEKNRFHAKICNTINGGYGVFQDRLIFRNTFSTMMYCEGNIMKLENVMQFSRAKFMVGAKFLTITTRDGKVMVWKKVGYTGVTR